MASQKNINTTTELTDKVGRAVSMVFTDYRGLTHKQLEDLRKKVKKVDGEYVVTKNTLLYRVMKETGKNPNESAKLDSPTATLFAYNDAVEPLKQLVTFLKTAGFGAIKGGIIENQLVSVEEVNRIATLPNRQTLIAQFVGQLKAPLYGLHNALSWNIRKLVWTLDAVKNKKQ